MEGKSKPKAGRPRVEKLTTNQRRTFEIVKTLIAENGFPPTLKELANVLNVSAPSVHEQVLQLVEKGYLSREPRKSRSLRVLQEVEPVSEMVEIPIVGQVAAGHPIFAEEHRLGVVVVDRAVCGQGKCFALRVQGESMIRAGIRPGDLIVVRQQVAANDGEIVVAALNGEVTVKRYHFRSGSVKLLPENPKFKPILVDPDSDFRILGRVVRTLKTPA